MENVNDKAVKLVAWLVEHGHEVREGRIIAEVETSKATFEITAPAAGKVWIQVPAGKEVAVGTVICQIATPENSEAITGAAPLAASATTSTGEPASAPSSDHGLAPSGTRFSKKALKLLQQHDLSPQVFAGCGMVREEDVTDHLNRIRSTPADSTQWHFALEGIDLGNVSLPAGVREKVGGRLDFKFLEYLKANAESFGQLPSAEKCDAYRRHGAMCGEGVQLGRGTVIVAPQICLGDGVQIGESGSVVCRDRFIAGPLTSFRTNLSVRGGTVVLGENVFGGSNVQIGGGGHADPWSLLWVGDLAYIGDDVFVNICQPILIGKEVFLTQRSILVTHNIGHSILEGYENRFAQSCSKTAPRSE